MHTPSVPRAGSLTRVVDPRPADAEGDEAAAQRWAFSQAWNALVSDE